MGLFDVFSKGGKYFGKSIEPKCEYCDHGKRSSDGNKVLCTKKGLVDAGYHCPKFLYSPLKRIPVKQMNMVGFLEGDYDEKSDEELAKKAEAAVKAEAERNAAAAAAAGKTEPKPEASADADEAGTAESAAPADEKADEKPAGEPADEDAGKDEEKPDAADAE